MTIYNPVFIIFADIACQRVHMTIDTAASLLSCPNEQNMTYGYKGGPQNAAQTGMYQSSEVTQQPCNQ